MTNFKSPTKVDIPLKTKKPNKLWNHCIWIPTLPHTYTHTHTHTFHIRCCKHLYQTSRPQSSVTAPNIPIMVSLCHNLVRLPPISLLQRGKNRSNVPSWKVTMHCPAPRCDSLKVRPMATSERKRGYRQLKTGLRRVHILQNKKKITPISAVDNKKKIL